MKKTSYYLWLSSGNRPLLCKCWRQVLSGVPVLWIVIGQTGKWRVTYPCLTVDRALVFVFWRLTHLMAGFCHLRANVHVTTLCVKLPLAEVCHFSHLSCKCSNNVGLLSLWDISLVPLEENTQRRNTLKLIFQKNLNNKIYDIYKTPFNFCICIYYFI